MVITAANRTDITEIEDLKVRRFTQQRLKGVPHALVCSISSVFIDVVNASNLF